MSYCEDSNINKSYIVQNVESSDIFSACTEIYLTNITPCTGDTININSNLNVTGNISGTTYYGDGSQLSGIITTDNYVTGGVYTASTKSLYFTGTTGFTPFSIDVSALLDDTNNYVTGGTYNPSTDTISLFRNDNVTIDITGVTDTFTTGGTYDNGTSLITFVKNDNTSYTVDLSSIDVNDTFVTGSTLNGDSLTIRRNDGVDIVVTGFSQTFTGNTSGTCIGDIYVSNIHSCSPLHINPNDEGKIYFGSTSGITIDVTNPSISIGGEDVSDNTTLQVWTSGNTQRAIRMRDKVTNSQFNMWTTTASTGENILKLDEDTSGSTVATFYGTGIIQSNFAGDGSRLYNIPLSGVTNLITELDSKTDLTLFNSHTGDTNNPHQTSFGNLTSTAHTHSISDVINLQSELDGKTNNTDFVSHTGDTSIHFTKSSINLSDLGSSAHTHTISEITDFNTYSGSVQTQIDNKLNISDFNTYSGNVQTELNTKISGATNLSSEGIFAQKNGLDLEFKGITSTGGTVNISSNSTSVNLEVTFPTDQDKFVSGGTYNGGTKEINFVGNSVDTTFDVDLTTLVSSVSANTYVIDGVYIDSTDTLSLLRNDGNFVNITGITDTFTTGGTYDNNTSLLSFTKNDSTTYDVDMSSLPLVDDITLEIDSNNDIRLKDFVGSPTGGTRTFDGQIIITSGLTLSTLGTGTSINNLGIDINGNIVIGTTGGTDTNTYVTGFTFNPSTYDLTIKQNDGQPDLTSNLAVLATDVYVVSGVYNPATGIVTYTNSSGGTFQVSGFTTGMTDSYTTAANLNGETIEFDNNIQGSNLYNVSLSPVLSGKTNNTEFTSHTGDTTIHFTKSSINLSDLGSTAHTHTLSEITDFNAYSGSVQTQLDNKTDLTLFNTHTGDTNNPHQTSFSNLTSTAHTHTLSEITDFNSYSGSVQTQIDSKLNITDFNTYSGNVQTQLNTKVENGINSGGANEVFSGKSGTDLYFRTISGGSNTTISTVGDIIKVDVSVPVDTNTFVTGGTYNSGTLTLDRNDGNSVVVTGFTTGGGDNFYVTGFTYNDANTFTISQNGGLGDLTSTINNVTGLTVNGNLDIIGDINVTGTTYYTNITGTSIGVDYIDFNNALTPLPADQEGRIYWDEDNGTLSLGMHGGQVVQQIGLENYYYVKNQSGATIENGRVVRAAGTLGSSGRILGEYMIADGTIPAKYTLGIATEDIIDGDDGYVTEFGLVRGIDTSGTLYGESWSGGTILYVSPTTPGGLTSVEPQAPDLKIEMAIVIDADANGSIFVRPTIYPHIYDLQEVNYTGGSENNLDILQWNSSNSTWDKTNTPSFSGLAINGDLDVTGDSTLNTLTATSITSNSAIDVFNGHINLRDNSYFLQGRTVADDNVSLIGVDNQDRVFIGNAGYDTFIDSDTIIDGHVAINGTPESVKLLIQIDSNIERAFRIRNTDNSSQFNMWPTTAGTGTNIFRFDNDNTGIAALVLGDDGSVAAGIPNGTEPLAKFHVHSTIAGKPLVLIEDETQPDSTPFIITEDGDVGIGTETPQELLHVSGNVRSDGQIIIGELGTGTSITNLGIDTNGTIVSGTTGETNTASNLGGGTGLFAQKNGVDLEFKSLTSTGDTITISNDSTTVNVEVKNKVNDANKIFSWFMNVT